MANSGCCVDCRGTGAGGDAATNGKCWSCYGTGCAHREPLCQPRRGDWMQTFTGRQFWPLDPRPEDIDPVDVAHALSMLCRYGGHTRSFYSVAEHCVLVSSVQFGREAQLAGLLHDAAEAYLVDLPRPIKRQPEMAPYRTAELVLWTAIASRFNLPVTLPPEVHDADNRILLTEREALMSPPPADWSIEGPPLGVKVLGLPPAIAEQMWLERLADLTGGASGS